MTLAPHSITFNEPVVALNGRAAFVLSKVLQGSLRGGLSLKRLLDDIGVSEQDQAAALEVAGALAELGESWRRLRLPQRGNAETRGNDEPLSSEPMAIIATAEAAALLSLGERQVRNLAAAGDLRAERTPGGPWRFLHTDVVGLRDRRARQTA